MEKKINLGVSVLICTYKGGGRLKPTLEALQNQKKIDGIPWEVILVDNGSKDNTIELARSFWKSAITNLKIIEEKNPGKNNAIKRGVKECSFEFICTVDDDNWVEEKYIYKIYQLMTGHPEIGIVGCHGEGVFEHEPKDFVKNFEGYLAIGSQGMKEGYVDHERTYLYGACAAFRKSFWDYLFNNNFQFLTSGRLENKLNSGEDSELSIAAILSGYRLWYAPDIKFKHEIPGNRLKWKHFKTLTEAFGRSDMVIIQYKLHTQHIRGLQKKMLKSYSTSLLFFFYKLSLSLIKHTISVVLKGNRKTKYNLYLHRYKASFLYYLINRKLFFEIKNVLTDNQWMKIKNLH